MPVGQGVATFHRQLKLNTTSAELYGQIVYLCEKQGAIPEKDLLSLLKNWFQKEHQLSPEESENLPKDIQDMLTYFLTYGVMLPDTMAHTKEPDAKAQIQSIALYFYGNLDYLSQEFQDFYREDIPLHQPQNQIQHICFHPYPMPLHASGNLRIHTAELEVYETPLGYLLQYPNAPKLFGIQLSRDGLQADFYVHKDIDERLRYDIFHAVRLVVSYLLQKRGAFLLHSASIAYKQRAWLFSGPSGTGKSTHTKLWEKLFQSPSINGDINLISIEPTSETNRCPMVHGIPWCGTSGIYDTKSHPLGGIVILHQAPHNHIEQKPMDQHRDQNRGDHRGHQHFKPSLVAG